MTFLADELSGLLQENNIFEDACKINGKIYRELEGRRTLRFQFNAKYYFLKLHFGIGWKEVFKNLSQLRLPVLGAENEWLAVNRLRACHVSTMTPVAYTSTGFNPAHIHSCLITESLENTQSLEELVLQNRISPPLRRDLIIKLADIAKIMHGEGINHRDFYLCHFLLDMDCVTEINGQLVNNSKSKSEFKLHLIDLHRAQIRQSTPERWRIKDIAGLLFSACDAGLSTKDLFRFIRLYTGKPLREMNAPFWEKVVNRAKKLYLKDHGRPSLLLSQF